MVAHTYTVVNPVINQVINRQEAADARARADKAEVALAEQGRVDAGEQARLQHERERCVYLSIYLSIYLYVCMCIYIYIYIYIYMYINMCRYVDM